MSTSLNLNDITNQIQHYVTLIKKQKLSDKTHFGSEENFILPLANDVRSNIQKLAGKNKFGIQQILESNTVLTSASYVLEAYNHLNNLEDKHKVVIDFMHKNNHNFDVNV